MCHKFNDRCRALWKELIVNDIQTRAELKECNEDISDLSIAITIYIYPIYIYPIYIGEQLKKNIFCKVVTSKARLSGR